MAPISLIINPNGSKYATVGGLNNEQNVVFLLWNTKKTCVERVKQKKVFLLILKDNLHEENRDREFLSFCCLSTFTLPLKNVKQQIFKPKRRNVRDGKNIF